MTDIVESNVFPVTIPLIDVGDSVEGGTEGAANKQAIALASRTNYLKIEHDLLKLKVGQLAPRDIGAEAAGTANNVMTSHLGDPDPHNQYLLKTDAGDIFVELSGANLPGGYVQLNSSGKIPAGLIDMIQSSYVVVADQTARLALPQSANLTICVQADIDTLFYLNGNLDPTVPSNWFSGQSATVSGVSRVFGRTGDVIAVAGDYNADQITETPNRRFLSTTEKAAYAAKQDKLVSGTNIRTLFQKSILGPGDLTPTPNEMGCAPTIHTHTVAEINDWVAKFSEQLAAKLKPGRGISVSYNSSTGDVTIDSSTGATGDGGRPYISAERLAAAAGQLHTFNFAPNNLYDLDAFALKSEAGATNQSQLIDTFSSGSANAYDKTNDLLFNGMLRVNAITRSVMNTDDTLFASTQNIIGKDVIINTPTGTSSIVPPMTSNSPGNGYVASASSNYSVDFPAYKAFDGVAGASDWCSTGTTSSDPFPWIRIDLPTAKAVSSYRLTRYSPAVSFFMKSWKFQGSNDNGVTWEDVHVVVNNTQTDQAMTFDIGHTVSFSSYRVLTTELINSANPVQMREFELLAPTGVFLLNMGGKNYTVTGGNLVEVSGTIDAAAITANGISTTGKLLTSVLTNPVKIISNKQLEVVVTKTPNEQIAIQKLKTSGSRWARIKAAVVTSAVTNNGKVRYAVSRDNVNWLVFSGGAWVSAGAVTVDAAGAISLLASGMTVTNLNAITEAQWALLYADKNGAPDYISFAYALSVNDGSLDTATIDQVSLTVDLASAWKKQNESEVEIRWYPDSVVFKTVAAGDYKLVYQIP